MSKGLIGLVENKTLSIFKTLLKDPSKIYHLNSLAQDSKVPVTSTSRIIKKLVKNELAQIINIGKSKFYKLAQNENTKKIGDFL